METQTSAGVAGTQVLPSLASSVLRNVFGGTQMEGKSTEISPNSSVEVPSEIAQQALTRLETRMERAATELGISKSKLQTILSESNNLMLSLDESRGDDSIGSTASLIDLVEDKNSPDPQAELEAGELRKRLAKAIGKLPEREKLLIALYYHENMTLKEIGEVISVSESRVCQLHAQAILRLRGALSQ